MTLSATSPVAAQPGPPPDQPPSYGHDAPGADQDRQGSYDQNPSGSYNVQPPPGYQPDQDSDDSSPQGRDEDDRYSYAAERWAADNCVAQRANNTAAGAVIGGILGAIIGSAASGGRGGGVLAGSLIGGSAGAAIGNSANSSNPNCPPGYVLRDGAPAFYPGPVYGPVGYAAPTWYNPWIWYGHHWIYRPYPYHRYWYHHHYGR
jgi:hypothetical protein